MALSPEERHIRRLATYARYRARNLELCRTRQREDKRRAYAEDPQIFLDRAKEWRDENREENLERRRAKHAANPEIARNQQHARYAANPQKTMAQNAKHRAAKAGAPVNDFTDEQFEEIKAHYKYRCYYCPSNCWHCARKKHELTRDHIIPPSKGGSNTFSNIIPACASHNSQKGNRPAPIPVQPLLLIIAPSKPVRRRKAV